MNPSNPTVRRPRVDTNAVALGAALDRWEGLLAARFPEVLQELNPGLDDTGVAQLHAAVEPLGLPAQVETLYRWRNGGTPGIFGGWRLRPLDDLLRWREFCLRDLEEPPAWLHLFDDQCLAFVTLRVPGGEEDDAVWFAHTEGEPACFFGTIAELVHACADAAEAGALHLAHGDLRLSVTSSLDGRDFYDYRLARSPDAYQYPDPPAGNSHDR
jgi:hypothetical protein